ncbi:MAG TPA: hypothetical protein VIX59_14825 [Candidatus Binataceae bacterium]
MSSPADDSPRRERILDLRSLGAFAVYFGLSLFFFGRALPDHFHDTYIGTGNDPSVSMWFFVWWPYAFVHHLDPFFTDLLWAPSGINLAWTTAIFLPSLVIWPLTASLGLIAAYNVLSLAILPLGAWTAFLLCRYICRAWWPSILGGYIFGFSAYMLGHQTCGQVSLTLVLLVPLAVLLIARAITGELARGRLIAAMTALLVVQFLISAEVFATMTVIGGMGLFLGFSFAPPDIRKRIARTLPSITIAYAVALVIVSPYLYGMFAFGAPRGPIWSLDAYSADLLNFIVPAPTSAFGVIPFISRIAAPFYAICEVNAYLGLPLIILAAAYAWRHWREPTGKLLVDSLIIICVLAMGPLLHFRGAVLCELPGKILPLLPALGKALPARFMMYAFLVLAIIASIWFTESRFGSAMKFALAATIVVSTLPNLSAAYWTRADDSPAFFTTALHRLYLAPGENVLVLPFGIRGSSMLWQAETGMYFRMAGGWTGQLPPEFSNWPIVNAFLTPAYLPDAGAQLSAFMARDAVNTIAVVDGDVDAKAWHSLASACCVAKQSTGGVTLYHVARRALAPYATVTALQMEQQADSVLFDTLLLATDRWLSYGNSLARLTPLGAQWHGLLPLSWIAGPTMAGAAILENPVTDTSGRYFCGAWLGPMSDGRPSVGVFGSYAALEPIIARYRNRAAHIYFPYPHELRAPPQPDTRGLMVMVFDRAQLAASASRLAPRSPGSAEPPVR